jgi:hypothetical protein
VRLHLAPLNDMHDRSSRQRCRVFGISKLYRLFICVSSVCVDLVSCSRQWSAKVNSDPFDTALRSIVMRHVTIMKGGFEVQTSRRESERVSGDAGDGAVLSIVAYVYMSQTTLRIVITPTGKRRPARSTADSLWAVGCFQNTILRIYAWWKRRAQVQAGYNDGHIIGAPFTCSISAT